MPLERSSVLVIDDDELLSELIAIILTDAGYEVRVEAGGEAGLRAARTAPPALVLCDRSMPGLSGTDVLRILKEDPMLSRVPFVLMSGDAVRFPDGLCPDAFLAKPFAPEKILEVVETLSEGRRLAA